MRLFDTMLQLDNYLLFYVSCVLTPVYFDLVVSAIGKDKTHINILVIGHVDHHWPSDLQAIREVDGGGAGVPGGAALDTPRAEWYAAVTKEALLMFLHIAVICW